MLLKRHYILITFLLASFVLQAQVFNPQEYSGIHDSDRMMVYYDHFDGGTMKWSVSRGGTGELKNSGSCLIFSGVHSILTQAESPGFGFGSADMEVETVIAYDSMRYDSRFRFGWGTPEGSIEFDIRPGQRNFIVLGLTSTFNLLAGPLADSSITSFKGNIKLTGRRVKGKLFVFVNEIPVSLSHDFMIITEHMYLTLHSYGILKLDYVRLCMFNLD